jgi:hypothetical protein
MRSPEYKARKAERRRQRYQNDPEYRARQREYQQQQRQKPEVQARQTEWRRQRWQDPDYRTREAERDRQLRTGMPADMYHWLLIAQAGLCAICDKPMMGKLGACADHDHNNPGLYRGLLCGRCNTSIQILEDPERLRRALAYLEEHNFPA